MRTLINLTDFFDPSADRGAMSADDWVFSCRDLATQPEAQDWMHANSVSRGADDDHLVSLRAMSALASLDATRRRLRWTLSAEVGGRREPV